MRKKFIVAGIIAAILFETAEVIFFVHIMQSPRDCVAGTG